MTTGLQGLRCREEKKRCTGTARKGERNRKPSADKTHRHTQCSRALLHVHLWWTLWSTREKEKPSSQTCFQTQTSADYLHIMNFQKKEKKKWCCPSKFFFSTYTNLLHSASVFQLGVLCQATFNLQLAHFPFAVSRLNVRLRGRGEPGEVEPSLLRLITLLFALGS